MLLISRHRADFNSGTRITLWATPWGKLAVVLTHPSAGATIVLLFPSFLCTPCRGPFS